MAKPQLVLVPGAWHTTKGFSLMVPKLVAHGYTVHTRQLPSVGNSNPPIDLSEDIAALRELVTRAIGDGNDVVVVPHSWAGIVAGSALKGFGKKEREANGKKGGVIRTAYMCAVMAPEGVSLVDALGGATSERWSMEGELNIDKPAAIGIFNNDLPESRQQKWYSQNQSHATSWKDIPTSYLLCEDDLAIPPFAQEAMTGMVKEMGGEIEVQRIRSSHNPFKSQPDVVVEWIRRVAGETL